MLGQLKATSKAFPGSHYALLNSKSRVGGTNQGLGEQQPRSRMSHDQWQASALRPRKELLLRQLRKGPHRPRVGVISPQKTNKGYIQKSVGGPSALSKVETKSYKQQEAQPEAQPEEQQEKQQEAQGPK